MGQILVASYEVTNKAMLLPLVMPEGFQAIIGLGAAGPGSNLNLSSKEI
jgi:hypothetical protein